MYKATPAAVFELHVTQTLLDILPKRIWLGMPVPAAEKEVLRIVEGKLAPTVIKRLISLGLQRSEIDAAIIPLRTLQHRRSAA